MDATSVIALVEEIGIPHERVTDPRTIFNIQVRVGAQRFVNIAAHPYAPHAIVIGAAQRFEDDLWSGVRRLTRREIARFQARLEQMLLIVDADYSLEMGEIGSGDGVRGLSVRVVVDTQELTRPVLRHAVYRADRARGLLRAVWDEFRP